jgi:hypothetical protein
MVLLQTSGHKRPAVIDRVVNFAKDRKAEFADMNRVWHWGLVKSLAAISVGARQCRLQPAA